MLQGESSASEESAWVAVSAAPDWREIDQRLREIARRRGVLDREEMVAVRDAMRVQLWCEVGCASMREYLERVFGYGPRVAADRLRVASALDAMPALEAALEAEELPYSAVREISRIATSRTAGAWVEACRGKCLREVEDLVAQHAAGDLPDSPPREHTRPQVLRLELEGSDYALWRQARQIVEGERDEAVSDRELFAAACTALVEHSRMFDSEASAPTARTHVGTDSSARGHAHVGSDSTSDGSRAAIDSSAGGHVDVGNDSTNDGSRRALNSRPGEHAHLGGDPMTDRARAEIDSSAGGHGHVGRDASAQNHTHVGSDLMSDGGRMGNKRARGGTQRLGSDAQRGRAKYQIAVVVCDVCKRGWQEGGGKRVPISDLTFELAGQRLEPVGPRAHVGTIAPGDSRTAGHDETVPQMRADAVLALHTLGFKRSEAIAAVDSAIAAAQPPFDLERLLRLALQRCPRPVIKSQARSAPL